MAHSTLQNFKSEVMARNLARPNRFEVLIFTPKGLTGTTDDKLVSLFCESTNLPTKTIGVKQQRIQGPAHQRPTTVDYGGEGITMTFIVDQQMQVKNFFDTWMEKVIRPYAYTVNYPEEYTTQIRIYQLNQKDEPVYAVTLADAFPKAMAQLELNHSNQNQVHKLSVTFAYRNWESALIGNSFIPKTEKAINTTRQSGPVQLYETQAELDAVTARVGPVDGDNFRKSFDSYSSQ